MAVNFKFWQWADMIDKNYPPLVFDPTTRVTSLPCPPVKRFHQPRDKNTRDYRNTELLKHQFSPVVHVVGVKAAGIPSR
jgi:hypothetical protein